MQGRYNSTDKVIINKTLVENIYPDTLALIVTAVVLIYFMGLHRFSGLRFGLATIEAISISYRVVLKPLRFERDVRGAPITTWDNSCHAATHLCWLIFFHNVHDSLI